MSDERPPGRSSLIALLGVTPPAYGRPHGMPLVDRGRPMELGHPTDDHGQAIVAGCPMPRHPSIGAGCVDHHATQLGTTRPPATASRDLHRPPQAPRGHRRAAARRRPGAHVFGEGVADSELAAAAGGACTHGRPLVSAARRRRGAGDCVRPAPSVLDLAHVVAPRTGSCDHPCASVVGEGRPHRAAITSEDVVAPGRVRHPDDHGRPRTWWTGRDHGPRRSASMLEARASSRTAGPPSSLRRAPAGRLRHAGTALGCAASSGPLGSRRSTLRRESEWDAQGR